MTKTKRITDFRVSWTADHNQYYQGHSTMFSDYTDSGLGCEDTLRESLKSAFEVLSQQDIDWTVDDYKTAVEELESQVNEPEMLDLGIVEGYCDANGYHVRGCPSSDPTNEDFDHTDCGYCHGTREVEDKNPDCSVCAGEWHYYVSIDVKVEDEETQVESDEDNEDNITTMGGN